MYSFVYQLYFALKRREKRLREAERKKKALLQKALDYCEWFYNVPVRRWYEKHPSKRHGLNRKPWKLRKSELFLFSTGVHLFIEPELIVNSKVYCGYN